MSRIRIDWVAEHRRLPPKLASWKVVRSVVRFVGDELVSGLVDCGDGYLGSAFESVDTETRARWRRLAARIRRQPWFGSLETRTSQVSSIYSEGTRLRGGMGTDQRIYCRGIHWSWEDAAMMEGMLESVREWGDMASWRCRKRLHQEGELLSPDLWVTPWGTGTHLFRCLGYDGVCSSSECELHHFLLLDTKI